MMPRLQRLPKHKGRSRAALAGFSMMEVLVSMSIFSIASTAIGYSFAHHLRTNNLSETRNGAVYATEQVLDAIRVQDPATLPSSGTTTQQVTIGKRTYSVTVQYCASAVYCTSNNIRALTVTAKLHGKEYYSTSTVFAQLR